MTIQPDLWLVFACTIMTLLVGVGVLLALYVTYQRMKGRS